MHKQIPVVIDDRERRSHVFKILQESERFSLNVSHLSSGDYCQDRAYLLPTGKMTPARFISKKFVRHALNRLPRKFFERGTKEWSHWACQPRSGACVSAGKIHYVICVS